ncbi:MAG: DUF4351 domain-containing protein, partial [Chloroflexota bacterium]
LTAQDTRGDAWSRQQAKLGLVRRLYQRGFTRERIISLFRFIDWLLALPHEAELAFRRQVREIEEEGQMPYITSIERIGRAEGREEGREEGHRDLVRRAITRRFGSVPPSLAARIAAADSATLTALFDQVLVADTLDQI